MKLMSVRHKCNDYLLLDRSGGYINIGESIDEAVLVIVGLDRTVLTLNDGKTNSLVGAHCKLFRSVCEVSG